jgi:transcriptional regulator with XRE-family HTH domain
MPMVPQDVDFKKVGARIRKLRLEKGLTQNELCEMIGCSNNHLSHVETAQNKVSLTLLLRLSYALEVSLDYFLLDTPFTRPEAIIDAEISKKLARCSSSTLVAVSRMIDTLLDQQMNLSE